jgi:hypothetical protein
MEHREFERISLHPDNLRYEASEPANVPRARSPVSAPLAARRTLRKPGLRELPGHPADLLALEQLPDHDPVAAA